MRIVRTKKRSNNGPIVSVVFTFHMCVRFFVVCAKDGEWRKRKGCGGCSFPSFNWTHKVTRTPVLSPFSFFHPTPPVLFHSCLHVGRWAEEKKKRYLSCTAIILVFVFGWPSCRKSFSFGPKWFLYSSSVWIDEAMMQGLIQISLSENLLSSLIHSAQFDSMKRRREGNRGLSAPLLAEESIFIPDSPTTSHFF